jgi:hypothetical protein
VAVSLTSWRTRGRKPVWRHACSIAPYIADGGWPGWLRNHSPLNAARRTARSPASGCCTGSSATSFSWRSTSTTTPSACVGAAQHADRQRAVQQPIQLSRGEHLPMQIQRDLGVALMVRPGHAGQQLVGGRADEPDREPPLLATCRPAGRRPGLLARLGQRPHPLVKHTFPAWVSATDRLVRPNSRYYLPRKCSLTRAHVRTSTPYRPRSGTLSSVSTRHQSRSP